MAKPFTPKIVTANDLLIGDVIYQTTTGWSRDLADVEILNDAAHADLRLIEATQQLGTVVGAYLTDITLENGMPATTHFREAFRAKGPSNYAHGKQHATQEVA